MLVGTWFQSAKSHEYVKNLKTGDLVYISFDDCNEHDEHAIKVSDVSISFTIGYVEARLAQDLRKYLIEKYKKTKDPYKHASSYHTCEVKRIRPGFAGAAIELRLLESGEEYPENLDDEDEDDYTEDGDEPHTWNYL